ncbi:MAG: DUF2244 domain-containing protein [Burkholderiaceae bacterium]
MMQPRPQGRSPDSGTASREWLLKRNCALTPWQAGTCFLCLGGLNLVIAVIFTLQGAWLVLPFAVIENLGLVAAFFWFGRHAADYERISAQRGRLVVETGVGPSVSRREKASPWFRVEYGGGPRELICVGAGNELLQVGRFVSCDRRNLLAREIRTALNGAGS